MSSFYKSCSDHVVWPVLCSSAAWYGDLRWCHCIGFEDAVSQGRQSMAKAQRRRQGNCDDAARRNCILEGHRCATAHLYTIACMECGGDVACLRSVQRQIEQRWQCVLVDD